MNCVPVTIFIAVAILLIMVSESNQTKVDALVLTGSADRTGDVDPLEAGRGCHHFPDVATAATPRHPADAHPKHGQHFQFHDGNSAHLRGRLPESGQWCSHQIRCYVDISVVQHVNINWLVCYVVVAL